MSELLDGLNPVQKEAVLYKDGPLIIFAGAGSGKTRILTRRAAYLISECGVDPSEILAITFTNKAANEMKERIHKLIGKAADKMWISTFHSMCVKILRENASSIGFDPEFTIYDTDDSKALIKKILKDLKYDMKVGERAIQMTISNLKNAGITAEMYRKDLTVDDETSSEFVTADVYDAYEEAMMMDNCLDFDDLLLKTKELFDTDLSVKYKYQDQFKYIMVDEYQDTNHIQLELVLDLAGGYENVCVVGDDDQSIYKFRGADITNILNFKKFYPAAKQIMLEQNYRSSKNILAAANAVISNNKKRTVKKLWTDNEEGEKIHLIRAYDEKDEAKRVISDIKKCGVCYSDIAILYRSNRQSRLLEEACFDLGVPYQIVGGLNFYQRKEIKDLICYLKVMLNPSDRISWKRIINVPKRSIGDTTISKIEEFADAEKITFYEALKRVNEIPKISSKTKSAVMAFMAFMTSARDMLTEAGYLSKSRIPGAWHYSLKEYVTDILGDEKDENGYLHYLSTEYEPEEASSKIENVSELLNKIIEFDSSTSEPKLSDFLEDVALIAEKEKSDEIQKITMMTLHSSKGLEFNRVYMVGMIDGVFPSGLCLSDESEIEEERRLCYVGMTRAIETLTLSYAERRMNKGYFMYCPESRFLEEIPSSLIG